MKRRTRMLAWIILACAVVWLAFNLIPGRTDEPRALAQATDFEAPSSVTTEGALVPTELEHTTRSAAIQTEPITRAIAGGVLVRVVDSRQREVEGARVEYRRSGGFELIGISNAEGLVRAQSSIEWHVGDVIAASKAGYVTASTYVADPTSNEVLLVLPPALALFGTVRFVGGPPPDATSFSVLGISRSLMSAQEGGGGELLSDPRVLRTHCREDGTFVLDGAQVNTEYWVMGAGVGILSAVPVSARAGSNPIEITARPLYGMRLRFVNEDGTRLEVPRIGGSEWGCSAFVDTPGAEMCAVPGPLRQLSGIPSDWTVQSVDTSVLLATANFTSADLGPMRVTWNEPGYERLEFDLQLPRLADGAKDKPILVRKMSGDAGWIEVSLSEAVPQELRQIAAGDLVLRAETGAILHLRAAWPSLPRTRVGPIPTGHYSWRFEWRPATPGLDRAPQSWREIDVTAKAAAAIDLDTTGTGALQLSIVDSEGRPYAGPANVILGEARPSARMPGYQEMVGDSIHFERPPYLIPVLASGALDVKLVHPRRAGTIPLVIRRGEVVRAELTVPAW